MRISDSFSTRCLALVCSGSVLLFAAGCGISGGVNLPQLPAWKQPADSRAISAFEVALKTRLQIGDLSVHVSHSDGTYNIVPHDWLVGFLDWTWHASKASGIRYVPETFDCEDFSRLFDSIAALAAAKAGISGAAPLIARVIVQQPAGRHELIGVVTTKGQFIVEPQPDARLRLIPLERFQNKILAVLWGDFNP